MREIDRSPDLVGRQVRPPSRETSTPGSVGQRPDTARQANVAELTASNRFPGVWLAVGDTVADGGRDVVLDVVGSSVADVGAALGDLRVAAGTDRVAEGSTAGTASAACERDLSSRTSKVSRTALIKTNPPMATFGQLPFEKSGMRRSLTAKPRTAATTGQLRRPVTVARLPQRPSRRHRD
jgi:hypothetical protein